MVLTCNATKANLDNRPRGLRLGYSVVILAPRVACTGQQHRTGCIGETKVCLSQQTSVTTCK